MLMRAADADRAHVGLDELHGVVDRKPGVDAAAGAVDVQADVLVGIVALEVDQLRHDEVGDLVDDGRSEEDDALVEQSREDVEGSLAAAGLLDHERNKWTSRTHPLRVACLSVCIPGSKRSVGVGVYRIRRFLGGGLLRLGHRHRDGGVGDEVGGLGH